MWFLMFGRIILNYLHLRIFCSNYVRGCSHIMSAKNEEVQTPPHPFSTKNLKLTYPPYPPCQKRIRNWLTPITHDPYGKEVLLSDGFAVILILMSKIRSPVTFFP